MSGFIIRPYQNNDFQDVMDIFKTNVPDYFDASEIQELSNYLLHEIEDYFVIISNDKIVGAGGINYDNDNITARLSWDFLDKHIQHKGAGTVLTQFRIQHVLKLKHIQKLIVRTSQFADGFYTKQGFQVKERVKDYWAPGFDMIFMEYQK